MEFNKWVYDRVMNTSTLHIVIDATHPAEMIRISIRRKDEGFLIALFAPNPWENDDPRPFSYGYMPGDDLAAAKQLAAALATRYFIKAVQIAWEASETDDQEEPPRRQRPRTGR